MDHKVIVVVEDDATIAQVLDGVLGEVPGYQALTVDNGAHALHLLTSVPADLVILDVNLPDLNGFALYDLLHSRPQTARLPCLFMSANDQAAELARRKIHDFLPKPFDLDELLERVETLLQAPAPDDTASS
jgi:DNA-binding response OmpR family regulator